MAEGWNGFGPDADTRGAVAEAVAEAATETGAEDVATGVLDVLDRLRTGADAATRGLPDLSASLGVVKDRGVLRAVLPSSMGGCALGIAPGTARALSDLLRRIGRSDLALARLVEGHVNAALLVEIHGDAGAREAMRRAVDGGALLGVWGADGPTPMEWHDLPSGGPAGTSAGVELRGSKRFASGLGHVTLALVTAQGRPGAPGRMFLIPADDPARHDHDAWTASAMRATRSGGFDATGLRPGPEACIGGPGDLMTEPWFEGGVWRYCAAHVGGAEGLIDLWTEHLERTNRRDDPLQRSRLGQAMAMAVAARATVEAAARAVEDAADTPPDGIDRAVVQSLLAREATEGLCAGILSLAERALGMAAHDGRLPIDAMRRNLSLFLRQAAPDAKLDRAVTLVGSGGVGELR